MEHILPTLNTIAQSIPWDLVAASGILSPVVLLVKKWLHLQSEKVMMTLVLVFGMVGAAGAYILGSNSLDPGMIAAQGLMVAAMSQPVFFLVVKPISTWFSGELAKARAYDAEVKSAGIPAEGLPISQTK